MNSSTSAALWPTPVAAHSIAQTIDGSQSILIAAIAADILTAVGNGDFTSQTDVSSESSGDVQYVTSLLNQGGYTTSNDGTNLNVSW